MLAAVVGHGRSRSVLQLSPLQIPPSLGAVTSAPARLWNSPGGKSRSRGRCRVALGTVCPQPPQQPCSEPTPSAQEPLL